jgi:ribosomal protein S18 acetylase RimI-like enzyme
VPTPELTIRAAGLSDVDSVAALVQSAYRGDSSKAGWTTEADLLDGQRIDSAEVAEMIGGLGEVLVAEAVGAVVACCLVEPRPPTGSYFGMFAVRPTLQSGGIGRRLLEAAEQRAVERWAARTMEMTVIQQRTELIDWYVRRGYRLTGQSRPFPYGDVSKGLPRRDDLVFVVLAKTLARPVDFSDGRST